MISYCGDDGFSRLGRLGEQLPRGRQQRHAGDCEKRRGRRRRAGSVNLMKNAGAGLQFRESGGVLPHLAHRVGNPVHCRTRGEQQPLTEPHGLFTEAIVDRTLIALLPFIHRASTVNPPVVRIRRQSSCLVTGVQRFVTAGCNALFVRACGNWHAQSGDGRVVPQHEQMIRTPRTASVQPRGRDPGNFSQQRPQIGGVFCRASGFAAPSGRVARAARHLEFVSRKFAPGPSVRLAGRPLIVKSVTLVGEDVIIGDNSPALARGRILLAWKLKQPASPLLPTTRPRHSLKCAWQASSTTAMFRV